MVERYSINFQIWQTYTDPEGPFVRYSDYATLEAQLAEIGAENERLSGLADGYGKLDADYAIAERRIAALEAQNERLRKALEPFAKAGELFPDEDADFDQWIYSPAAGDEYALSSNHLRAARRALDTNAVASHETGNVGDKRTCATEGCDSPATNEFIRGDVGSFYCGDCFGKVIEVCEVRPAPEAQQKPVAWQWLDAAVYRRNVPADANPSEWRPLYPRPAEQAVTEAMVEAALVAWFEEITWSKGMTPKMKGRMLDSMRAALKAAMEAGR